MHEIQSDHRKLTNIRESHLVLPYDIAATAEQYIGHLSGPYDGPEIVENSDNGIDCSEFVCIVFQKSGIPLSEEIRHTNEFLDTFGFNVDHGFHRRGDLIFFSFDGGVRPTHMGIVLSQKTFIHAPGKKNSKVRIGEIKERPIVSDNPNRIYAKNPISYKRPSIKKGRFQYPFNLNDNF